VIAFIFIYKLGSLQIIRGKRIAFGTQNVFWDEGAHTGQISPVSLKSAGIEYVLIGHSEMRALGETDEMVAKKTAAALNARLHPVVCIGETARDTEGKFFSEIERMTKASLSRVEPAHSARLTIAYEPVWAIGKEEAASPRVAVEAILYIRKTLADMWGRERALKTRIIYGASVTPENAAAFAKEKNIQGLLPGRASVNAEEFTSIIKAFS
jgi:triosephosphate isomerase